MEDDERDDEQGDDRTVTPALDALAGLEDRPVAEHLAAFEEAHRELRSALQL